MNATLRSVIVTWIAVYPTITLLLLLTEPVTQGWPLPLRTLLLVTLMVPMLIVVVRPFVDWVFTKISRGRLSPR